MKYLIAIALGILLCADLAPAKVYERCDLARELLYTYNYQRSTLGDWICLIQWESGYNTAAKGENTNGSVDNGLYQVNDYYWCYDTNNPTYNDCKVDCAKLLDDNIADDVDCANLIYSRMGFDAWYGWINHCKGTNTESYVSDCGI